MYDYKQIIQLKRKYETTGLCDNCGNRGLLLQQSVILGVVQHHGYPCGICEKSHGYNEFISRKYANGIPEGCKVAENVFTFPTDIRFGKIAFEAWTRGEKPTKLDDCDNLLSIEEYLGRE